MAKIKAKMGSEPQKKPKAARKAPTAAFNTNMEELASLLADTPVTTRRKNTIELLKELGNEMAATETYGSIIHDFLNPERKLAPAVEGLPADPNSRLVFIINHVKVLQGTLHSIAHMLGAVQG